MSAIAECAINTPWWVHVLALSLVLFVERWLGRTSRVRAGSLVDLSLDVVTAAWKRLKGRKDV